MHAISGPYKNAKKHDKGGNELYNNPQAQRTNFGSLELCSRTRTSTVDMKFNGNNVSSC